LRQVVAPTLTAANNPSRSPQSSEVTAQVVAILHAEAYRAQNWDGQGTSQTLATRLYGGNGAQQMPDKGNFGAVLTPICARESGQGFWMEDTVAGTLRAEGENRPSRPSHIVGLVSPVAAGAHPPAVAFTGNPVVNVAMAFKASHYTRGKDGAPSEVFPPLSADADKGDQDPVVHQAMAVRRLTAVECERLQGFPDDYTAIPWRNKTSSECPDGPRYKALGNSMAVPVMRWLGNRINNRSQP
jgi:site-specific DNA-cytosine methylase